MLPNDINEHLLHDLIELYKPGIIFDPKEPNNIKFLNTQLAHNLNEKLCLLLSTSGSTGSPKLVRLSRENLENNSDSIIKYLSISNREKALCSLPLSYSYGLSVLNSHLKSGATVFLTDQSPFDKEFYEILKNEGITSIAGVPFFYNILFRTGFLKESFPDLRTMTQAGGNLPNKLVKVFNEYSQKENKQFFVMYGQTEATARMTYYLTRKEPSKIGSIGIPIPGGKIEISSSGELIYHGKNVMLGYANSIEDLSTGDINNGRLPTGDIAKKDSEGFFYITGRKKRFIKIAGSRFNLDELESSLEERFAENFIVSGQDEKLFVGYVSEDLDKEDFLTFLYERFSLKRAFIKLYQMKEIPFTKNGKKDYHKLKELSL
jgi:long-subunit acyl-CoA synthetase (AMP-forming)